MCRKEFERTSPESVGIHSQAIEQLLDTLESGFAEPHGLMIMRFGKICAEGWWSPYAPGIRHSLQSHTKTYASTAIGIAYTEHLLKLDDRIIDIFKDESPENPSENLKKLTVHDVLCMGCGMDEMPHPSKNWIHDFLAMPVNHVPGTVFMYNSTGSTLLGAIIKKLTGLGLHDYLKPRLFDKIGINADNLRWVCMPDGVEVGGGGLYATTEDNLRLMKLYADGGKWDGERILAEDFVSKATSKQNDTESEREVIPEMPDHFMGYGYQLWMCKRKGAYRADGALGQFTIVVPDKQLLISITQNADGSDNTQRTLDAIWTLVDTVSDCRVLPENLVSSKRLAHRMERLALPRPVFSPFSKKRDLIDGKKFSVTDGTLVWDNSFPAFMSAKEFTPGIKEFTFHFTPDRCILNYLQAGKEKRLYIAIDGSQQYNSLPLDNSPISNTLVNGAWISEDVFEISVRWLEAYYENKFSFKFSGNTAAITCRNGAMMGKTLEVVSAICE